MKIQIRLLLYLKYVVFENFKYLIGKRAICDTRVIVPYRDACGVQGFH